MVEKTKKQKKGSISEDDISTILKRYPASTVLTLLQEVAQVAEVKIDWNELVKKTNTGISSAREYQMLWRHLAYRDSLLNRLDEGDQTLDDDSDLEYELEPFPSVSSDASTEAAAFVKVLIASGSLSDPSLPTGTAIEAPLTISIPNGQSSRDPFENSQLGNSMQGTNITVPVYVRKQLGACGEGLDANGVASGQVPPRRKRKIWSQEEDDKLKAAVEKCGEGNWATILKEYFNSERKASQLSQRWAIIRKRPGNTNGAGGPLAAAHRAMSLELDRPNTKSSNLIGSSVGPQSQRPQQDCGATVTAQRPQIPAAAPSPQSRVTSVRPPAKSALSPDKMVKAAAVAAGARIATASDAASLLQAAKAKNAVHVMPVGGGGGSLIKSNPLPNLHPNVHYIRTGTPAPPPRPTRPGPSQLALAHIQSNKTGAALEPNAPSETTLVSTLTPTPIPIPIPIPIPNPTPTLQNGVDVSICSSGNAPGKEKVEENRASSSGGKKEDPKERGKEDVLGNNKQEEELLEKDKDVASGLGDALDVNDLDVVAISQS